MVVAEDEKADAGGRDAVRAAEREPERRAEITGPKVDDVERGWTLFFNERRAPLPIFIKKTIAVR